MRYRRGLISPAAADRSAESASSHGLRLVAPSQVARGDLVLFDWQDGGDTYDHIARVVGPPSGQARELNGHIERIKAELAGKRKTS